MKKLFTVLNYTWGIVNTILGLFVALSFDYRGQTSKNPKRLFLF